jgi:predicted transposase YdaD
VAHLHRELDGEQAEERGELDDRVHGDRRRVLEGIADGVADDARRVERGALLLELDLDELLRVVPSAAGVGHEDGLVQARRSRC